MVGFVVSHGTDTMVGFAEIYCIYMCTRTAHRTKESFSKSVFMHIGDPRPQCRMSIL